ncbi:hypothetical protein C8J57DRAFT_1223021 [Mycena rebaudengoi]|nr:hypothetical protein C8J57DRAFT_1223021 [Mycena rebaudengoi]
MHAPIAKEPEKSWISDGIRMHRDRRRQGARCVPSTASRERRACSTTDTLAFVRFTKFLKARAPPARARVATAALLDLIGRGRGARSRRARAGENVAPQIAWGIIVGLWITGTKRGWAEEQKKGRGRRDSELGEGRGRRDRAGRNKGKRRKEAPHWLPAVNMPKLLALVLNSF